MNSEKLANKPGKNKTIWVVLAATAFLLAVFFLMHAFVDMKRHGFFGPPDSRNFHKKVDVADIEGWMTFDFLNKAFNLPPDYLKKELGITDKKYPDITIDKWIKDSKEDPGAILNKTKKLIQDLKNSPAPPEIPTGI